MNLDTHLIKPLDLEFARIETEKVIQQSSKTFHFATRFLPLPTRIAIHALYAFCRKTDDLVDRQNASLEELERWRKEVDLSPQHQVNPVLLIWSQVREQYLIDRRYEQELLNGVGMDLAKHPYRTWQELECYCYHVASTVGLLSIPIIGLAPGVTLEQARPYAIKLGIALQLTNILRDVGEDARAGRVYLPDEDLEKFGLTRQDILRGVYNQAFRDLIRFEIDRARVLYCQALPGIALLDSKVRPAVGAAALLYEAILDEIEAIDYQVHQRRAFTTLARKILMLPRILLKIARLRRPMVF
ncbi:MAG: phytoene/squalene synthase family protein [Anaerolineae bacterium]|nr:phytoene/squalene synthase family protein [Anaerolineae bacterium]